MGRDKALLPWEGGTLLDHAVGRLARVTPEVRILCGPAPRYGDRGRRLVPDAAGPGTPEAGAPRPGAPEAGTPEAGAPGAGPLAGLAAALADADGADALLLGVDLPLVTVELLAALAGAGADADAVVPAGPRGPEPLCALYRAGCRAPVERRLAAGDLRMTSFWPEVRVRLLEGDALAALGDPERLFANLNAPEDYRRVAP